MTMGTKAVVTGSQSACIILSPREDVIRRAAKKKYRKAGAISAVTVALATAPVMVNISRWR